MWQRIKKIFHNSEGLVKNKILAIESDIQNEIFLRKILEKDFDLLISREKTAGFEMAATAQPDLIIVSCKISGEKTIDLCEKLKSDPKTKTSLVLVIAESSDQSNIAEYYLRQIDAYLIKPIRGTELIKQVKFLINDRSNQGSDI